MEDGQLPMMEGLEVLWKGEVSEPQTLLSAGKTAFSPAASAAGSKMVRPWFICITIYKSLAACCNEL